MTYPDGVAPPSYQACGKLILLGEHFVVHGTPALAVPALTVSTRVDVVVLPAAGGCVVDTDQAGDGRLASRLLRSALEQLDIDPARGARVTLRSSIPPAAGLGSSAALAVALVGALARAFGRELSLDELRSRAHELEKLVHGTPSGVDDAVVARAAPVWFVAGQPPRQLGWPPAAQTWRLVAASDGARRQTRAAVAAVARRREEAPGWFEALSCEAAALAEEGRRAFERGDGERLGRALDRNQALLEQLGVSTEATERLVVAARSAGACGAKITGAGGGGFVVALVSAEAEDRVAAALRSAGARRLLHERLEAR